jgi:hypothetical protein
MHIARLGWEGMTVVKELRHRERSQAVVDYESVVVAKVPFMGGLASLQGLRFCHPGLHYGKTQKWSERFLKHFERTVVTPSCDLDGDSPAEIEAGALSRYFGSACRPGVWSHNSYEDAELSKYPF